MPVRPLTPALSRATIYLVNGRKTPLLIVIPAIQLRIVSPQGQIVSDQPAEALARAGWTRFGEPLKPHRWCLTAEGAELGITDGEEYIAVADVDSSWLTHVISHGVLDVIYNPLGTPGIDDRIHLTSPYSLCARLPLLIPTAA